MLDNLKLWRLLIENKCPALLRCVPACLRSNGSFRGDVASNATKPLRSGENRSHLFASQGGGVEMQSSDRAEGKKRVVSLNPLTRAIHKG